MAESQAGGAAAAAQASEPKSKAATAAGVAPAHGRKEASMYASGSHALFFGGTPAGDRLQTHVAIVGHLQRMLNYEFPYAQYECSEWADGLRRQASAPMFPPAPTVPCPPPQLLLPASPLAGTRRKRPLMDMSRGTMSHSASMGSLRSTSGGLSSPSRSQGPQLF
eukprot:TRINITY_DN75937_c0_g1_i1.p1 TRINITY_DN75937_c0_g1~~TRINITY_DN75937_c0_g1_i1.p1  ORF type:complete len:165 (+),score=33.19 TRINITY_DN75937_c0_g1_i1:70-564(+)